MDYIIYATGILAFLLIYVAFKLSNTPEDKILKFFLILLVAGLFVLLAKGTLDNRERCFPVVNLTNDLNENSTQFFYKKYCYTETPQTPLILYKWVSRVIIGFISLFVIYSAWWLFSWINKKVMTKRLRR